MKRFLFGVLALTGLLAVVPATIPATTAAATAASSSSSGTVSAPDQKIREGCRSYYYGYRIDVPGEEWMAELQLLSPRGRRLANVTVDSAAQRSTAQRSWKLCAPNLRPGRFTITMLVTTYDGREVSEQRARPTTFRLTR